MNEICTCGCRSFRGSWGRDGKSRRVIRRTCRGCGRFRGYAPQTSGNVAEVNGEPLLPWPPETVCRDEHLTEEP
jgi:hypothetical protein